MSEEKSFWSTLPGILTALAAVITAIAGLVGALYQADVGDGTDESAEAPAPQPAVEPESRKLRSVPVNLDSAALDTTLVRLKLFARDRSPIGAGIANRFEHKAIGDAVVIFDHATGLSWHRGSNEMLDAAEAEAYVRRLNTDRVASYADWRLPTVEEALSLMKPEPIAGYYFDPILRGGPVYIKTADRSVENRIWMVDFADGTVGTEHPDHHSAVRAVR